MVLCINKLRGNDQKQRAGLSPQFPVCVCSRLIKTDMELEVLRYTNRISSEAHKMVKSFFIRQSLCKGGRIVCFTVSLKQTKQQQKEKKKGQGVESALILSIEQPSVSKSPKD